VNLDYGIMGASVGVGELNLGRIRLGFRDGTADQLLDVHCQTRLMLVAPFIADLHSFQAELHCDVAGYLLLECCHEFMPVHGAWSLLTQSAPASPTAMT